MQHSSASQGNNDRGRDGGNVDRVSENYMTRLKTYIMARTAFLVLAAIGSLMSGGHALAQGERPTARANVNELLRVPHVAARTQQPFQGTFFVPITNGEFSTSSEAFAVPQGKRPVIKAAAASQSSEESWDNLQQLHIGQKIQVVDMKLKSIEGEFSGLSDERLSLRRGKQELMFPRTDVLRVGLRGGGRLGNSLIGLTIGALAGLATGAVVDAIDDVDRSDSGSNNGKISAAFAGLGIGAGIGAAFPGYHTIYRSKRQ